METAQKSGRKIRRNEEILHSLIVVAGRNHVCLHSAYKVKAKNVFLEADTFFFFILQCQ